MAGALTMLTGTAAQAAQQYVDQRGDFGWQSRDTRSAAGANLVAPADNAAIDAVIKFGAAPGGVNAPTHALNLITPTSNSAKATLGVSNLGTGFGNGTDLGAAFTAEYKWYTEGAPTYTNRISPLKIGVQTSAYGSTPAGGTRTGDNDWDMLLVHFPNSVAATWNTESISYTSGLWYVVNRGGVGGNTFSTPVSSATPQTLSDIYNGGSGYGGNAALADIFASTSKLSVIEFGLGSSQQNANNFVSYLETSIYNGGDAVHFVPEPSSLAVIGLGAAAMMRRNRRQA
jgi:hypothetical protein